MYCSCERGCLLDAHCGRSLAIRGWQLACSLTVALCCAKVVLDAGARRDRPLVLHATSVWITRSDETRSRTGLDLICCAAPCGAEPKGCGSVARLRGEDEAGRSSRRRSGQPSSSSLARTCGLTEEVSDQTMPWRRWGKRRSGGTPDARRIWLD